MQRTLTLTDPHMRLLLGEESGLPVLSVFGVWGAQGSDPEMPIRLVCMATCFLVAQTLVRALKEDGSPSFVIEGKEKSQH